MNNRKVFVCMLVVGLVSILVTTATFTWLYDNDEISWTIQVKTADLEAPEE